MAITKKLESKIKLAPSPVEAEVAEEKVERRPASKSADSRSSEREDRGAEGEVRRKKVCLYCTQKSLPAYWDASSLRKFTSDRGRIQPRARTGVCAKHQRRLSKQIKYARHLSLLPFTVRV
jgi:small subunit ribosomal protein S18